MGEKSDLKKIVSDSKNRSLNSVWLNLEDHIISHLRNENKFDFYTDEMKTDVKAWKGKQHKLLPFLDAEKEERRKIGGRIPTQN